MQNGDRVQVYGADNKWHECTYIGKSQNKGHYIVYTKGKPLECAIIKEKMENKS